MATFLAFPIMAIAAVLQATFVPQIRLFGGGPDFVFLIVLAWAINADLDSSVIWAFVGGIMVDLLSSNPVGTTTFGLILLVFAMSGLGEQLYRVGFMILIGLVIGGTVVQQIIILAVTTLSGFPVDWLFALSYIIIPTIFYNLLFIWPTYWIIRRIQRRILRRVERRGGLARKD